MEWAFSSTVHARDQFSSPHSPFQHIPVHASDVEALCKNVTSQASLKTEFSYARDSARLPSNNNSNLTLLYFNMQC